MEISAVISSARPQDAIPGMPERREIATSPEDYVSPGSVYNTGDLVPPSVTDNTTRHLEIDKDGETMTLRKP